MRVLALKIGRRDEVYDVERAELKRFVREIVKRVARCNGWPDNKPSVSEGLVHLSLAFSNSW